MQNSIRQSQYIGDDTNERVSPPAALSALNALGLKLAGISDAGRRYHMHRPRPMFGHLLVTLGGVGRVWLGGEWTECRTGQAYVSPAYAPNAFETVGATRWHFAWVFFDANANRDAGLLGQDCSSLVSADGHLLAHAIDGLYGEGIGQADAKLLQQWGHLLATYSKRIVRPSPAARIDPLARLWMEVDSRLTAPWSIASLANQAGVSSETLRKLCAAHHNKSPIRQLTHLRLRRADTLLRTTSAKLSVVARMVGYENVFAFSTAYKRVYGVSPSMRRGQL